MPEETISSSAQPHNSHKNYASTEIIETQINMSPIFSEKTELDAADTVK